MPARAQVRHPAAAFDFRVHPLPQADHDTLLAMGFLFDEHDGSIRSPENGHPLTRAEIDMHLRRLRANVPEPGGPHPQNRVDARRAGPSSDLSRRMETVIAGVDARYREALRLIHRYADPRDLEDFVTVMERQRPPIHHEPGLNWLGAVARQPFPPIQPGPDVRIRTDSVLLPNGKMISPSNEYYRGLIGRGFTVDALDTRARPVRTSYEKGIHRDEFADGSSRIRFGAPTEALILLHEMMHHQRHAAGGGTNTQSNEWHAHSAEFRMLHRMLADGRTDVVSGTVDKYREWQTNPARYRSTIWTVLGERTDIQSQRTAIHSQLALSDDALVRALEQKVRTAFGLYHEIIPRRRELQRLRDAGLIDERAYAAARGRVDDELRALEPTIRRELDPAQLRSSLRSDLARLQRDEALDAETERRNRGYLP
ncbi:MAG: hypothetical protein HY059_22720 [Proteobacteria bacterium]|nr:hypothetical protein [Pseudomonadota bacterium]